MSPLPSLITAVPSLAALTLDTVRTFLHLLGVAGWIGGQILMLGLLGVLRWRCGCVQAEVEQTALGGINVQKRRAVCAPNDHATLTVPVVCACRRRGNRDPIHAHSQSLWLLGTIRVCGQQQSDQQNTAERVLTAIVCRDRKCRGTQSQAPGAASWRGSQTDAGRGAAASA